MPASVVGNVAVDREERRVAVAMVVTVAQRMVTVAVFLPAV